MSTETAEERGVRLVLILLALSTIIDGLDSSIVNVALPTISNEFGISVGDSSWITLAYVIPLAALLLPGAKMAKNGCVRKVFTIGLSMFTASSALCGISSDFIQLVLFRLIQGIGASLMTASTPVMIAQMLPEDRKGVGMGILAVASGVAIVLGPSIGGLITSAFNWHWIFLINVPIGIIVLILAHKAIPADYGYDRTNNPDLLNSFLTVFGIGLSIVFLQNIVRNSIGTELLVLHGIGGALFLALMMFRMYRHPEISLIPTDMLRRTDFKLLCIAFTMTCIIIVGTQYLLPYFFQITGEFGTMESGLLLSVASVFAIILSVPVGRWCDTRGCRVPSILAGVFRMGFCILFFFAVPKDDLDLIVLGLAIMGCSMAFAGTGLATAIIHHSDKAYQNEATAFLLEINYVAASLGTVLYAIVFDLFSGSTTAGTTSPTVIEAGFDAAMLFGCALSAIAIICAVAVKNIVPEKKP